MSENEPLINFNCACGKPVQTPASLCGQKLHCPYPGCEVIIDAPASPEAATTGAPPDAIPEPAPAGGPRKPRMPPPKGLKGGKGKDASALAKKPRPPGPATSPSAGTTEGKPGDGAAATPASVAAPESPGTPPPKKKNKLFFAACSGITLIAAVIILNNGKSKSAPAPAAPPVAAPAPPAARPSPAPAARQDPAPPVENGGRKPRQQVDADALSARLAERLAEQKKATAGERAKLITAAENGDSDEWIALAADYLQHNTEENRAEARKWLEKAAARKTSRAFLMLGELEQAHGTPEKAVSYYVKGAASISSGKSATRDAKLESFASKLDELQATREAARIRARIAESIPESTPTAKPDAPTPAPAEPAKTAPITPVDEVPAIPAPREEAPGIPAPPEEAPGIPELPEPVPGIPEPPSSGTP